MVMIGDIVRTITEVKNTNGVFNSKIKIYTFLYFFTKI